MTIGAVTPAIAASRSDVVGFSPSHGFEQVLAGENIDLLQYSRMKYADGGESPPSNIVTWAGDPPEEARLRVTDPEQIGPDGVAEATTRIAPAAVSSSDRGWAGAAGLNAAAGRTDIYIGGVSDHRGAGGPVKEYVAGHGSSEGRTVAYFAHDQVKEAIEFANTSVGNGRPVNIIGHSWGASSAVAVAAGVRGAIDTLVGVDPVDKPGGGNGPLPQNVAKVVTVNGEASEPNRSDSVERRGVALAGRPEAFTKFSNVQITTKANHEDFEVMFSADGADGRSAKDIVEETSGSPAGQR